MDRRNERNGIDALQRCARMISASADAVAMYRVTGLSRQRALVADTHRRRSDRSRTTGATSLASTASTGPAHAGSSTTSVPSISHDVTESVRESVEARPGVDDVIGAASAASSDRSLPVARLVGR